MPNNQPLSLHDITCRLDAYETCDPEFDDASEELERHFAELRLTFGHE